MVCKDGRERRRSRKRWWWRRAGWYQRYGAVEEEVAEKELGLAGPAKKCSTVQRGFRKGGWVGRKKRLGGVAGRAICSLRSIQEEGKKLARCYYYQHCSARRAGIAGPSHPP